jgi:hypothetical protein
MVENNPPPDKQMCDPKGTAFARNIPSTKPCPTCQGTMMPVFQGNCLFAYRCVKCGKEVEA